MNDGEALDALVMRAFDRAISGDVPGAQAMLAGRAEPLALRVAAFFDTELVRAKERAAASYKARHDGGNLLAVAQASIEGMLDGVVPITDARLRRIHEILGMLASSIYDATSETR